MPPLSPATKDSWPPNYIAVWAWRQRQIRLMRKNRALLIGALEFYRTRPVEFICHWCDTYDPRNAGSGLPTRMPFILFKRQVELVEFIVAMVEGQENGLVEKCRDAGATWVACAVSAWMWRFVPGTSVGWGSRKEQLVDKLGDPDSIFEKMRMLISGWPREFWSKGFSPADHMPHMKIVNPETGATITGEAGDNIGRGGRKSIYFKDEAGHYERPEKIEAALADNTRVQIDISSVNGPGNVFHRRREAGVEWGGGPAVPGVTNVFIFDWRDHPAKDDDWYEARRRKAEAEGLRHVFAQEVDRNYFAAVEGTIINATWVRAAIDAHVKLGLADEGAIVGGLDVADEGGDRNALALRRGPLLLSAEEWGDGDTGTTARRAITRCSDLGMPVELQYDSVGVGAGVKAEANRLDAEGKLPRGIRMTPWSAGAGPIGPDDHVEPGDEQTPLNRDFYANLKAQGWWQLRRRFEKTWRALNEGVVFPAEELISLPSDLPMLRQIEKELCQPTATRSTGSLKLVVNKTPAGTRSPNVADAIVMAYWPVLPKERKTFTWYAGGEAIEG